MTKTLTDGCYCYGELITENLTIKQDLRLNNLDISNITVDSLDAESIISTDITAEDKITAPIVEATQQLNANQIEMNDETIQSWSDVGSHISSLSLSSLNATNITAGQIEMNDETIQSWSDIGNYLPLNNAVIYEGSNVLKDDLTNSSNKIISSNPNFYTEYPYHYAEGTAGFSLYQPPIIENQRPWNDRTSIITNTADIHEYYKTPLIYVGNDVSYHVNSILPNIEDSHGKTYTRIHTDSTTSATLQPVDIIGFTRLYKTTNRDKHYDITVCKYQIFIDDAEIALPSHIEIKHCLTYSRREQWGNYIYLNQELIVVAQVESNNPANDGYWWIIVIKDGDVSFIRKITEADKPGNNWGWLSSCVPPCFHITDTVLMIPIKTINTQNNATYLNFFTLDISQPPSQTLTLYNNGQNDLTDSDALITQYMNLKVFIDPLLNDIILMDDWNYEAQPYPTDVKPGLILVITPYHQTTHELLIWWGHNTGTGWINFVYKGLLTYNNTWYVVIYNFDSGNHELREISLEVGNNIMFGGANPSTEIYNSAKFRTITDNNENLYLNYCNWTERTPYIVYCSKTPQSDPTSVWDSITRRYSLTYYQIYNINQNHEDSSHPVPDYLKNNHVLCSNNNIITI